MRERVEERGVENEEERIRQSLEETTLSGHGIACWLHKILDRARWRPESRTRKGRLAPVLLLFDEAGGSLSEQLKVYSYFHFTTECPMHL